MQKPSERHKLTSTQQYNTI